MVYSKPSTRPGRSEQIRLHEKSITGAAAILLALTVMMTGCFRYSFTGAVPSHIKTVAIPLFQNNTAEYGVVEQLTDELILVFQNDNTLKIADETAADAVLRGTLLRVEDAPYTYAGEGEAENFSVGEYKLTLIVKVEYYDQVKDEVIWEQEVQGWGTYNYVSGAPDEREEGFNEAIDKLAEDVLNLTVSGW